MKKWYAIVPMLLAAVIFAGCSGGTDDVDDGTGTVEDAAPAVVESEDEAVVEEAPAHDHGDGEHSHSHAVPEVSSLGDIVASLDGSKSMEIGCGSCTYGLDGVKDCVLAAVVDDKPYLVTGVEFDAHANGLCKATKMATIVGKVHADGIEATKVELTD